MSRLVTKPTKWHVRPAKTQISLGIYPVWSESSLSAWRKLGSLTTHWVHSEGSDQTGRMSRLIRVFAGRTVTLLVLSWGGSNPISAKGKEKNRIIITIIIWIFTTNGVCYIYSADQALDRFAMKRFYDDKLGGLPQPSQRRYVSVTSLTLLTCSNFIYWKKKKNTSKNNTLKIWKRATLTTQIVGLPPFHTKIF